MATTSALAVIPKTLGQGFAPTPRHALSLHERCHYQAPFQLRDSSEGHDIPCDYPAAGCITLWMGLSCPAGFDDDHFGSLLPIAAAPGGLANGSRPHSKLCPRSSFLGVQSFALNSVVRVSSNMSPGGRYEIFKTVRTDT